ncbi:ABC transporter ATP-binding protein [Halalkalibacter sp. APA_J-10(15)]|uniref:ABC transporter ATP-binding protein n=1 Tax=Halalkalibacter sp. APA_J-10(15) TaxID=2933805 RepID=UPI001FF2F5F3|nr:ABC transporter ATP-binding protein [Halalkalibacter sp. APA_J-10(15)]MCK0471752.1 ABC transporter ATP-binding protein [Halalkalibacter sp. APA_J-10(15)]
MIIASMNDVVKRYGSFVALDYVNLTIKEGEVIGLLGPNGAGKTTLIQVLTGIISKDNGTITLFGDHKKPFSNQNKQQMGLVTQELTIFEDLTAKENLEFFAGVYGLKGEEKKQRVEEALRFVGLSSKAKMLPKKFSGGMKRRLNIACALTHNPKLVIMDEPTVGIDPQSRNHILETVKELQRRGITIIYTTHYMEEVQAIASRVVIVDQGQLITEGTTEELIQTIQHEEKLVIDVTDPHLVPLDRLQSLTGVKQVTKEGSNIHIVSTTGSGNLDRVLSIVKSHTSVLGIQSEKPNLEDVFLTLTGKQLRDGEDE